MHHHPLHSRLLVLSIGFGLGACSPSGPVELSEEATRLQPVVGGRVASTDELYSTVGLVYDDGEVGCTGTLISPTLVVSAAHCVSEAGQVTAPGDLQVFAGAIDGTSPQEGQLTAVAQVHPHPDYSDEGGFGFDDDGVGTTFDISVLVLAEPLEDLEPTPVLPLDLVDEVLTPGDDVTITGYGIHDLETYGYGTLNIAEVPFDHRSDTEFMAGGGAVDSCFGDSGGPGYVFAEGQRYLVGATSRGVWTTDLECGGGGVYTLVPAFAGWIDDAAAGDPGEPDPGVPTGPEGSCEGACGGPSQDGACYCDAECADFGDCCDDYGGVCLGEDPTDPEDPTGPEGWTCPAEWVGDDFCDCGCGAPDSDCADASLASCEFDGCDEGAEPAEDDPTTCVASEGGSDDGGDDSVGPDESGEDGSDDDLAPGTDDAPPSSWRCEASAFGDGICHCGCGALDSDCADATAASCERHGCQAGAHPAPADPTQCTKDEDDGASGPDPSSPAPAEEEDERPDLEDPAPDHDVQPRARLGAVSAGCSQGAAPPSTLAALLLGLGLLSRRRRRS